MSSRKRKADEDGDESMSTTSPSLSARPLARPSKKVRAHELIGRPLALPRLLETLDTDQLRMVLNRICETRPEIGQEVIQGAPRPTVSSAINVLRDYQQKLKAATPYGESSPEYTYYRVKEPLVALLDALNDFTPQFLPPQETQPTRALEFLDEATVIIHELPDWEPQAYRHHKDNAYEDISKAWDLVIKEAEKRGGGFSLHSAGWDARLARHNERSGGRLGSAITSMATSVGWMGHHSGNGGNNESNSILDQVLSSTPVRVGPW
jgi:protein Cut8